MRIRIVPNILDFFHAGLLGTINRTGMSYYMEWNILKC